MPFENFRRMSFGYVCPQCDIYITDDQGNLVCMNDAQFNQFAVSYRVY